MHNPVPPHDAPTPGVGFREFGPAARLVLWGVGFRAPQSLVEGAEIQGET